VKDTGPDSTRTGIVARVALWLTAWAERWIPDAFIFALLATVLVVIAGTTATPATLGQVVDARGRGFWELIPFTLQMALVIVTGHVLATSRPIRRLIGAIASWPTSPQAAVALVTFFALVGSWFNWGFSLIFSAVLAREIARRLDGVDYRALAAASFLGIGSIWRRYHGHVACEPSPGRGRTARDLGIDLHDGSGSHEDDGLHPSAADASGRRLTPGVWLEQSPILTCIVVAIGSIYLVRYFRAAVEPLSALTLNALNLSFLLVGTGRRNG
jgi:short-chain fatty acids transporter